MPPATHTPDPPTSPGRAAATLAALRMPERSRLRAAAPAPGRRSGNGARSDAVEHDQTMGAAHAPANTGGFKFAGLPPRPSFEPIQYRALATALPGLAPQLALDSISWATLYASCADIEADIAAYLFASRADFAAWVSDLRSMPNASRWMQGRHMWAFAHLLEERGAPELETYLDLAAALEAELFQAA